MEYLKSFPSHMDFEGQRRAERIFQSIIVLFGLVGLVWGYAIQQFSQTVYILVSVFLNMDTANSDFGSGTVPPQVTVDQS
ncbi:unnamed protein product, partial [Cyprideis torosa]